jgi:putative glycosyltransferase
LDEFLTRILKSVSEITDSYEIILVDDGSPGNAIESVLRLKEQFPSIVLVELSRNFGHHAALMTGLEYAQGEYIFAIDSDVEEPAEMLPDFYRLMLTYDWDVVYGSAVNRKGGFLEKYGGWLFYKIFNYLSPTHIPKNLMTLRLMKKEYVQALLKYEETHLFLGGVLVLVGFRQLSVPIPKIKREGTSYTFKKRLAFAVNALVSFSDKPLLFIANTGILITFVSILLIMFLIYKRLYLGISIAGWTSVMVSIWFLGGLILLAIGIVGIYVGKIFMESKKRPRSIVRRVYR